MFRRIRQILSRQRNSASAPAALARQAMVRDQLQNREITSPSVLRAMGQVPRENFVADALRGEAYADRALPIAQSQTISQPYVVALMTQLLDVSSDDRVLEIGTGSGYQTAVLAELAKEVVTIERHAELSRTAQRTLADCGYSNITYVIGDGSLGWPKLAPYDRILVTAAAKDVPPALTDQLVLDGVLVGPFGEREKQTLQVLHKRPDEIERSTLIACRFVPLIGQQGFAVED